MNTLYILFVLLFTARVILAAYEDARCKCVCVDRSGSYNGTRPTGKIYVKAIAADQCTCPFMLDKDSPLCPYCDCKYQVRNTTTIKVVVCLILVIISALTLYMGFLLLLEPLLSPRRRGIRSQTLSVDAHSSTLDTVSESVQPTESNQDQHTIGIDPRKSWADISTGQQPTKGTRLAVTWNRSNLGSDHLLNIQRGDSPDHPRPRYRMFKPSLLISPDDVSGSHRPATAATAGVSTMVRNVRDQQQRWKGNVEAQRARVFQEHTLLN